MRSGLSHRRAFGERKKRSRNEQTPPVPALSHPHAGGSPMSTTTKVRFATIWLDGCSGCHMSLLDTDERLIEIAPLIDLVYGPLVDAKEFPEGVDVTLVE